MGVTDLALLGWGGFANVFRARWSDRDVAVKILRGSARARFAREAAALRHVGTPTAPALLAEGEDTLGRPYQILELLGGPSLGDWLASQPGFPAPIAETLSRFRALCQAVDHMHATGILHRDLKPDNMFFRADGSVTLIDFGLARTTYASDEDVERLGLTMTGQLLGTVPYMAPEQCEGRRDYTERGDLYAVGAILFEMLTGRPPFVGEAAVIAQAHVSRRPPLVSSFVNVSPRVDDVLSRALAKHSADRFPTALAIADAAEQALAAMAMPASVTSPLTGTDAVSATREIAVALVRTDAPMNRLADEARVEGGIIIRVAAGGYLLGFSEAVTSEQGVRAALQIVDRLDGGSAVVHVAPVRITAGPRGIRIQGAAVQEPAAWAPPSPQPGVVLTREAAQVYGLASVSTDDGWFRIVESSATPIPVATRLCGRAEPLARARENASRCLEDRAPSMALIVGDVGHGKTRVLDELAEWADLEGFRVYRFAGQSGGEGDLVRELLLSLFSLPQGAAIDSVRRACVTAMGEDDGAALWPAVGLRTGVLPPDHAAVRPVVQLPGALRQATARAIAAGLAHRASRAPVALVLDDAHWADPSILDAIEQIANSALRRAIWIVAATRLELPQRKGWIERERTIEIVLDPLDRGAAVEMTADLLRSVEHVPQDVRERIVELSQGIPLHLHELVNALLARGALRSRGATGGWYIAAENLLRVSVTPLGERLARALLGTLLPELRLLAQVSAVVGDPLERDLVDRVWRQLDDAQTGALDVGVGLTRLQRAGVLCQERGHVRFRHAIVRDAIEAAIATDERRRLHDAAWRCLAARSEDRDRVLPRLARHAAQAGATGEALALTLELATLARRHHRYVDADLHYTTAHARASGADPAIRLDILAGRADVRYRLRRMDEALADVREAAALATQLGREEMVASLSLDEATILDWLFDFAGSARIVDEVGPLLARATDLHLVTRYQVARGRVHWRAERLEAAIELLGPAAEQADRLGDLATRIQALLLLSPALGFVGREREAEHRFEEVVHLCHDAGDRLHLAVALCNRMLLSMKRGDAARTLADGDRAIALAGEVGNAAVERVARYNVAEQLLWIGRPEEAWPHAQRSRDLQARLHDAPAPEDSLLCARIAIVLGRLDEARVLRDWIAAHCLGEITSPSQRVLLRVVELACEEGSDEDWLEVVARSATESLSGERLEVLYTCALVARGRGRSQLCAIAVGRGSEAAGDDHDWRARFVALAGAVPAPA